MASLKVTSDQGEEKYELTAGALTVGRGLESEVRLKDIKASRRHCQILKTPDGYKCLDLSSGNGTYINGVQIKEQKLNSGDQIQIGSTTITFTADAAAKPARAATGRVPAAAGAAARQKGSTGRVPTAAAPRAGKPTTGKIPVAGKASKPTTGKVPVAAKSGKTTTGKVPIASAPTKITGRVRKGTQAMNKATTGKGKGRKATGRTTSSFGSASQRFHADARKPKVNQFKMVIVAIILVFLGVVGFILFGSGKDPMILEAQFNKLMNEANKAEGEYKLAEAIKLKEQAIALVGDNEKYKTAVMTFKTDIKRLTQDIANLKKIEDQFKGYKKKFEDENLSTTDLNALRRNVKNLQKSIKEVPVTYKEDVQILLERIDKMLDTAKATMKRMDFQDFRNKLSEKHKLTESNEATYGPAITEWKDQYLTQSGLPPDNKNKANNEISRLENLAVEGAIRATKRAKSLADDNMKAMAVEYLKKQRERFVGCAEAEAKIEEALKALDR